MRGGWGLTTGLSYREELKGQNYTTGLQQKAGGRGGSHELILEKANRFLSLSLCAPNCKAPYSCNVRFTPPIIPP